MFPFLHHRRPHMVKRGLSPGTSPVSAAGWFGVHKVYWEPSLRWLSGMLDAASVSVYPCVPQGGDLLFTVLFQQFPQHVWPCTVTPPTPKPTESQQTVSGCWHGKPLQDWREEPEVPSAGQAVEQSLSPWGSTHRTRTGQEALQFWTSLVLPVFPLILKIYQLPKNNYFLFKKEKKKMKECGPLFSISVQGTSSIWLRARERIMQSPIRLVCIFFQDDSLSLLATDGLWQPTTLAVMPVYDFICVTLHVTAAFFLLCWQTVLHFSSTRVTEVSLA